jgi:hypothetical protein
MVYWNINPVWCTYDSWWLTGVNHQTVKGRGFPSTAVLFWRFTLVRDPMRLTVSHSSTSSYIQQTPSSHCPAAATGINSRSIRGTISGWRVSNSDVELVLQLNPLASAPSTRSHSSSLRQAAFRSIRIVGYSYAARSWRSANPIRVRHCHPPPPITCPTPDGRSSTENGTMHKAAFQQGASPTPNPFSQRGYVSRRHGHARVTKPPVQRPTRENPKVDAFPGQPSRYLFPVKTYRGNWKAKQHATTRSVCPFIQPGPCSYKVVYSE